MQGLVESIAAHLSLSRATVHRAWKPVAQAAVEALSQDLEVNLLGLAHLRVVLRPERVFTHPLTQQEMVMPAERLVIVTPAPALFCAANPKWTPEDAAQTIIGALPEEWEDREILDTTALLHAQAHANGLAKGVLEEAALDTIINAVIAASSQERENVLVLDGIGHFRLVFREGYIGVHPDTLKPLLHRSQAQLRLDPGLDLRAELTLPG
jgi:nucleoid DNA-binding protein